MKVLLPICDAFDAKLILDFVANYRWIHGTDFRIMHVLGSVADEQSADAAHEKAERLMQETADRAKKLLGDCEIATEISHGSAAFEILNTARDWHANMIVMGYRAERVAHPYMAGSVSQAVSLQAPCSVAVIRPPLGTTGKDLAEARSSRKSMNA